MGIIPVEDGHCDPAKCNSVNTQFISCDDDDSCTICGHTYAKSTPIKQLLKGSMAVPWVRLRFEGDNCPDPSPSGPCTPPAPSSAWDYTEITTGNISQPKNTELCRAVIKGFHYSWGSVQSGNVCKITIHDESGSSFDSWFWRQIMNTSLQDQRLGRTVAKMKVKFGWLVVGGEDAGGCPAEVTWNANCTIGSPYSSDPKRLICSPDIWFVPVNLTSTSNQGKFVYELEGRDLMMVGQTQPRHETFASVQTGTTHFVDAVAKMGITGQPPFNVRFAQLTEDGEDDNLYPLEFYKRNATQTGFLTTSYENVLHVHYVDRFNSSISGELPFYKNCSNPTPGGDGSCSSPPSTPPGGLPRTTSEDLVQRGPLHRYSCDQKEPMAAITHWMQEVMAATTNYPDNGKGITVNYDSTFEVPIDDQVPGLPTKGRVMVWADAGPGSIRRNQDFNGRKKGLYIVNGGSCSPVISFTPNMKWHWNALQSGGFLGPSTGASTGASEGLYLRLVNGVVQIVRNLLGNTLPVRPVPPNTAHNAGPGAGAATMRATQENFLTNSLHNVIEGDLRVQGDPSPWLCSPAFGYGRTVAIVMINPFYLQGNNNNGCPDWTQSGGVCHDVLTNRNWFVMGAEHVIKEGSFTTTMKLTLLDPRAQLPSDANECGCRIGLGGDNDAVFAQLCGQGTENCPTSNRTGGFEDDPGTGDYQIGQCVQGYNPCGPILPVG